MRWAFLCGYSTPQSVVLRMHKHKGVMRASLPGGIADSTAMFQTCLGASLRQDMADSTAALVQACVRFCCANAVMWRGADHAKPVHVVLLSAYVPSRELHNSLCQT